MTAIHNSKKKYKNKNKQPTLPYPIGTLEKATRNFCFRRNGKSMVKVMQYLGLELEKKEESLVSNKKRSIRQASPAS